MTIRILAATAVVAVAGLLLFRPGGGAGAQDDGGLRTAVADLRTRVAALETAVADTPVGAHTIRGSVRLQVLPDDDVAGEACDGGGTRAGMLDDPDAFREGGRVVVLDATGAAIAAGELGPGGLALGGDDPLATWCVFPFVVPDVPDAPAYGSRIGDENLPPVARADLAADGWRVDLEIEDDLLSRS